MINATPQAEQGGNAAENVARLGESLFDLLEDGFEHHRGPLLTRQPTSLKSMSA